MKPLVSLTANKWYPLQNGKPLYPTPQSILRKAVGAEEYKFVAETVTTDHIRAAVIMPLDVPFQHLLSEVPWGMTYTNCEWRMLIVSVLDPTRWLELARASGAKAWLKGHNMTITYDWESSLPELDEHGLKKRPGNALGATRVPEPGIRASGSLKGVQKKEYDKAGVIQALQEGTLSQGDIGKKFGIARLTVHKISKEIGLSKKRPDLAYTFRYG